MMRRLLLLLLALGLWQIAYSQVHCAFEPPDCQEGACELCHFADISPLVSGFSLPSNRESATVTLRPSSVHIPYGWQADWAVRRNRL